MKSKRGCATPAAKWSPCLKTGSAYFSPASAAIQMTEAFLFDKKEILPCAALLEGEYGVSGYYFCVPVMIGAGGVEKVIDINLNATPTRKPSTNPSITSKISSRR